MRQFEAALILIAVTASEALMDSIRSIDDLEGQLADIRRRIERLGRFEQSLVNKLQFARSHAGLMYWVESLGCKKVETAWRKFKILEYIDSCIAGLSVGELQEQMRGHGILYNYSTVRVEITRLRDSGLLEKVRRSKKWIVTSNGKVILDGILKSSGEGRG